MYIIMFIKFKILQFHACVYPNVDEPSRYDYNKVDGV